jgi:hypothetical protein
MIIRYSNGQAVEAVLLSRTETSMRIAPEGHDDVVELTRINDTWVSDDCEAVQVSFAWTPPVADADVKEEDCICPQELAVNLIRLLYVGDGDAAKQTVTAPWADAAVAQHEWM